MSKRYAFCLRPGHGLMLRHKTRYFSQHCSPAQSLFQENQCGKQAQGPTRASGYHRMSPACTSSMCSAHRRLQSSVLITAR